MHFVRFGIGSHNTLNMANTYKNSKQPHLLDLHKTTTTLKVTKKKEDAKICYKHVTTIFKNTL